MFAHQVIEDIQKQLAGGTFKYHAEYENALCYCIQTIREATMFHCGSMPAGNLPFAICEGRVLFSGDKTRLRLPYKKCYFDWFRNGDIKKQAIIAEEHDHVMTLLVLQWSINAKQWGLEPIKYGVPLLNIGKGMVASSLLPQLFSDLTTHEYFSQGALTITEKLIYLLNCKNITTDTQCPSGRLNKARQKRGKQELFTYKTLKLLLPGNRERHILRNEPSGEHNRIHFCRGHFKEYTKEHPLFGRLTGLYWWQPHVRGQNKDGIVMKDYEVKPE